MAGEGTRVRAVYLPAIEELEEYHLSGDSIHHLIHVIRIQIHEELLLLNGQGLGIKTSVIAVSKKSLTLKRLETLNFKPSLPLDLVLGIPKKEALELSLRQAVELGVQKIFLIRSDYSQNKLPELERIEAILISALEQSNAPFLPKVELTNWGKLPVSDYHDIVCLDARGGVEKTSNKLRVPILFLVGPEGGWSPQELELLGAWPQLKMYQLPTPILRTPTAVAAGAGFIIGRLMD